MLAPSLHDRADAPLLDVVGGGPGRVTLAVSGELDIATAVPLRWEIADAVGDAWHVVIDLGGVSFADAAGLRAVRSTVQRLRAEGRRVDFELSPCGAVDRLVDLLRLRAEFVR